MLKYIRSKFLLSSFLFCSLVSIGQQAESIFTSNTIELDGESKEADWELATWYNIDQMVLGSNLSHNDFSGKFKSIWDENYIYVLAEIIDDSLSDDHKDPTDNYWNDDCIEVFIDENNTSEVHQYNHNAFAYHVSIMGEVVDLGLNQSPILLPNHIQSVINKTGENTYNWEMRIAVYDDDFNENNRSNFPVNLSLNKELGFTIGYCDNDEMTVREHFILSQEGQGDTGWINSSGFGSLKLVGNINGDEALLLNNSIELSPNPATNKVYFSEISDWTIFSLSGELLLEGTSNEVAIESLNPGVYLIHLDTKVQRLVVK